MAQKKPLVKNEGLYIKFRQRPTLPRRLPRSTIGAKELNFRVRDGNGCSLFAIATGYVCNKAFKLFVNKWLSLTTY